MLPHPDFADAAFPRDVELGGFHLTPLSPEFVQEDFEAVTAAAHLLNDIFDDWPADLTLEDNLLDLAWHEREFTSNRSFSWIIRDQAGAYLGCFYLFPEIGARGRAKAALWFADIPEREASAGKLKPLLQDWLDDHVPAGIEVTWTTSPAV